MKFVHVLYLCRNFFIMESLLAFHNQRLRETPLDFLRYNFQKINWDNRLVGLLGPRGVGKTTLVLQHVKRDLPPDKSMYVTAEHFYFAGNRLYTLADDFQKQGGKYLIIDEIHKYRDWSNELKLIYEAFPKLHVVFTGSSVLDIRKGAADLSRRAVMHSMQGLSFREYLRMYHGIDCPEFSLNEILAHKAEIPDVEHPLPLFADYLRCGYYPFGKENNYDKRLQEVVNQTLLFDIPLFSEMNISVGHKLKQLLAVIAQSVPFKPSFSKIGTKIGVNRNYLADYFLLMEEAGMIARLRDEIDGVNGLGKVNKVYLDNTNLIYGLAYENSEIGNVRETFFFNQMRNNYDVTSSAKADFTIDTVTFEVGGRQKNRKQIEGLKNAYIVKDNIEFGYGNIVPLWAFGLTY